MNKPPELTRYGLEVARIPIYLKMYQNDLDKFLFSLKASGFCLSVDDGEFRIVERELIDTKNQSRENYISPFSGKKL